jgi:signal transduction histidine kinase
LSIWPDCRLKVARSPTDHRCVTDPASPDAWQRRFAALTGAFPDVLCLAETAGAGPPVPVFVSERLGALTASEAPDWATIAAAVHPEDRAALEAGEPSAAAELRLLGPDGACRWARVRREDCGDGTGHLILLDVTAAKEDEEERRRMELELRLSQKLEAVGQLAAGIAHEINTPVQFVGDTIRFLDDAFTDLSGLIEAYGAVRDVVAALGTEEAVLARLAAAEETADLEYLRERVPAALARARDGTERVATIVRAIRDFAHPPTTVKAPVDVNQALANTLIVAANEYKYVADVECEYGELPPVVANAGDLNQVFLNLVVNAAQAIEDRVGDGGDRGTISIATAVEGERVVVSIADTGVGIAPEVAGRVFDPFFTTKEVGRGTGQGLAISHTIVNERHAGSLTFASRVGEGTTFFVRLPIDDPVEAEGPDETLAA